MATTSFFALPGAPDPEENALTGLIASLNDKVTEASVAATDAATSAEEAAVSANNALTSANATNNFKTSLSVAANSLSAGSTPTVTYDPDAIKITFGIPQGAAGATGPQGPTGPAGSQGLDGAAATVSVGTVTTGAAGSSASVTNAGTSSAAVLNFTIPRGDVGATGPAGTAATISVGTVTTGAPGSSATVTNVGTSSAAVFNFSIPKGDTGAAGSGTGDVVGPASATDNAVARFDGTTGKLVQNSAVTIADDGTTVIGVSSTSAALRITQTGSGNALVVEDSTNPDSTPFVVNSSGQVIVGATSPITIGSANQGIQVVGAGSNGNFTVGRYTNDATGSFVGFGKSRATTIGGNASVSSGDALGNYIWYGDDGSSFVEAARIAAAVDGTPGTNDMPGRLVFSTTADGASSPTERFRISNFGGWGLAGANYGTSGTQAIVSNGNAAAPTWQTVVTPAATQALTNKTYEGLTLTAAATGFTVAGGTTSKTLTVSNTLTLAGTDASTLNIGAGGTLGSAAFTASTAYAPATSGTAILKGNGAGGTASAVAGTDYVEPSTLSSYLTTATAASTYAPISTTATLTGTQTLTNKTLTDPVITGTILEDIFALTDGATVNVDPGNGSIQTLTLAGTARTLTFTNMLDGESVTLMINDGTAGTITTWNATWVNNSGAAPTLSTTAYTVVVVWKVGGVVYAAVVGNA